MKRDVETILTMGIMEDVTIIPQPVGGEANLFNSHFIYVGLSFLKYLRSYLWSCADSNKVDLVMNLVERPSGGFSAGGGISSGLVQVDK